MRKTTIVADLSSLPDYAFGPSTLGWWGTIGFMLIEGMAFVLGIGALLYLVPQQPAWPPASPPPDLLWGTLFTLVVLLSEIPNIATQRAAKACDAPRVRVGLVLSVGVGIVLAIIRGLEFTALNERWDANAYGSIIWALMLMHTIHVATDVYDSGVLAVLSFVRPLTGRRFSDVEDNATYWHFVAGTWLVIYALIYWLPRILAHG